MEYGTVLLITFVVSVVVMIIIFIVLALRSGKRGNIDYLIVQTYLGNKRPVFGRGMVTLDNVEKVAIFQLFGKGTTKEIGTFHQKHLYPNPKGGFLMLLDQFEIGRFRPMEITDETKEEMVIKTAKDFLGQPAKDKDGNPIRTATKQESRVVRPVSNDDVDFIIGTRERLKEKLTKRAKKKSFWRTLAAISIYFFLFLSIAFNAFYNYESHKENIAMMERQSEANVAKVVTETIMHVLMNQTIKDVVKQIPQPP